MSATAGVQLHSRDCRLNHVHMTFSLCADCSPMVLRKKYVEPMMPTFLGHGLFLTCVLSPRSCTVRTCPR